MKKYISGSTIHLVNKNIDMGFSLMTKSFSFPKKISGLFIKITKLLVKYTKEVYNSIFNKIVKRFII